MGSYKPRRYNTQKSPLKRFLLVLGVAFFLGYLVLGYMLIFTNRIPLPITKNGKLILGILVIVYGLFRCIRVIQQARQNDDE